MIEYNAYIVSIEWYDDVDHTVDSEQILITATNYDEAMQQICEYYGDDRIVSVKVECLHENPIRIDDSIVKQLKDLNNF